MTIDDYGSLITDAGVEHALGTWWWETQNFTLPVDTRVVTIEGDNPWLGGGILASFSNGVVTDGTWQCADMSSCNTTECENSVTWQDAKTYGVNANHSTYETIPNIDSTAQWIWVENAFATRVWCKKTFGKFIKIIYRKTILNEAVNFNCSVWTCIFCQIVR